MGTASSKISDTGDVKVDIPVNYQAFTFKLTKDHVTNPAFIPMMTKEHVEHSAFIPTPTKERVENPACIPTPTKERVENPAFIPTPSEKQDAYKDVIASLQRDLHTTHERAEVALNDLSVLNAEVEKLRHEKDEATRILNLASKAAKLAREKSLELQTEVEKLRAERLNNTQHMYQSHKAPAETASEKARCAAVVPITEHETILKVRTQKMEELEGICNELRNKAQNGGHVKSQDVTGHIAEVETIQGKKYSQAAEIARNIMNGDKERCDQCLKVLELYLKLLTENKSVLEDYKKLYQTATSGSALNGKATDLINQQAETIRKLEELPKPYWVFEERRFWDHCDWTLRPLKSDGCAGK